MSKAKTNPSAKEKKIFAVPNSTHEILDKYKLWLFLFWVIGVIAICVHWVNF
jgi:hypothetical protein